MRSPNSPLTRLGLAVTATLLGLATVTAAATADPTDPSAPPTSGPAQPPSTSASGPAEPPSSQPAAPPSETETPPSSDGSSPVPTTSESDVDGVPARPLNAVLAVTMEFNKNTYRADEIPTVRVRLTNKDNMALTGIVAVCEHGGSEPNLTGEGKGWGALAGDGVTIPGGATKAVEVYEAMPAPAADVGYVRVDCAFAQSGVDYGANPRARAEAAVPGRLAEFSGEITNNDPAPSRAGFRVLLTRKGCPVVAEGTSDAAGRFSLGQLPVGRYELYVVPPSAHWFFKYGNHVPVDVIANRDNDYYVVQVWEDDHDNPDLAQPPNCTGAGTPTTNPPAPRGSSTPGLAHTGANLVLPGLAGVFALLLGTGALLFTRRRKLT
ncbi:carboxypeptidase-like regulatory domain-containing protein [Actinophytocola sp.]|uniref:carboxypeptidase-like regulatory domain-containing protein n=1 Tax=Actinophytocola sp. TaxID=1872138 RepID=UPI00389AD76C